ncbi:hypothetical protein CRI85_05985 [Leuconostoc pseudomesenteroides]|uniref:hypothetical protein n=1 Tax=Leuconostoc pseudomesenteroides TaxID=33968 RepID=UPI001E30F7F5|nr:hypothetical protein [Leuconostoc pseudomesenteroides]MCC8439883.1 hypothetical protein [Leuconostoc pseudomesenteroides]
MTEPVAWRYKNVNQKVWCVSQIKPDDRVWGIIEPLYTAEQLQPHVKMTQSEFDEFKQLIEEHGFVLEALQAIYNGKYKNLNSKLFNGRTVESDNEQVKILTNLMSEFDPNNPEETIEIVPEMKWFVRSKDDIEVYLIETEEFVINPYQHLSELELKKAVTFDTEEEAEKWTNPLTEAVQLPVEGE